MLVMVNLAVYFVVFVAWMLQGSVPEDVEWLIGNLALPSSAFEFVTHPWTILSYMFCHLGLLHIAVNMLWLLGFGGMMKSSPKGLVVCYLVSGILGGCGFMIHCAICTVVSAPLVGASAAVVGVVVASTILSPNRQVCLLGVLRMRLKWLAAIALLTLLFGPAASVCAHLGGAFGGLLCGLGLLLRDRKRSALTVERVHAELETKKREALRRKIIAKAGSSGFASLSAEEKLEMFRP